MLYKAKFMLNQNCLKSIYCYFINCHSAYENIVSASPNPHKLKKINNQLAKCTRAKCTHKKK